MANVEQFKWLSIQDLKRLFKLTEHIPQEDVDRAVNDALEFDVTPVISDTLVSAVKAILLTNPIQWSDVTAYTVGTVIFWDGVYYKCATAHTNSEPSASNSNWTVIQLMAFWVNFVKKYFCAQAYYRLLLWHGANITQFGSRQNTEDTSAEISDKRRGELSRDVTNKAMLYLSNLNKAFQAASQTFDGVKYVVDCGDKSEPNKNVTFFGVSAYHKDLREKKNHRNREDEWNGY